MVRAVRAALSVDRGIAGDIYRHIAKHTAANARSTLAAGGIVHLGIVSDGHRAVAAATAAANACTVQRTSGCDGAAGDLDLTGIFEVSSADACTSVIAGGFQTAVFILILK